MILLPLQPILKLYILEFHKKFYVANSIKKVKRDSTLFQVEKLKHSTNA